MIREDRELLVARYFEGIDVRALARKAGVPEGTIKWRLSRAREKLKREWIDMEEKTPRVAVAPARVEIELSGTQPEHNVVPELTTPTRQLLLWTLREPMTARDAAERTGIPTMLVEEELDGLRRLEAAERRADGRYQTTFFIETLAYRRDLDELSAPIIERAVKRLREATPAFRAALGDIARLDGAALDAAMPTLLTHLLHDGFLHWPGSSEYAPPLRPDGARYYFMACEYAERARGLALFDWYGGIAELEYRTCAPGSRSVMERIGLEAERATELCLRAHRTGEAGDATSDELARLIRSGALARDGNGALRVTVPWLDSARFARFSELAGQWYALAEDLIAEFIPRADALLVAHMPARLRSERSIHRIWALFDVMLGVIRAIWPDDARDADGLIFVETQRRASDALR